MVKASLFCPKSQCNFLQAGAIVARAGKSRMNGWVPKIERQ